MSRTHVIALGLALALVAALGLSGLFDAFGDSVQPTPARALAQDDAPASLEPPAEGAPLSPLSPMPDSPGEELGRTADLPADIAGAATAELTCTLLGRAVDEDDQPLVGAKVRVAAYRVWSSEVQVPRLEGPVDYRGFEVETDETGSFRIEAPVPTADRTWLSLEPDPYHDSYQVYFADANRSDTQPPLRAGTRDLGVLRLATTGALRGRVTDASGAPVADVRMGIGPARSQTYGRNARTAHDGSYHITHAPVGTYGVSAFAEGYLSVFRKPVIVEAARDTLAIDFVLERAPTLEGLVTSEAGLPLAGVNLESWPGASGKAASAKSGADGRFAIALPQDEPYTLSAKLDGYLSWGEDQGRRVTYSPGTHDLEIVLKSMPRTRFLVVDDQTGEPVERFGLSIVQSSGSKATKRGSSSSRSPREADHPGGVVEVAARPGIDAFLVASAGYVRARGDVEHEPGGAPEQTVRLRRGASLTGRVLRDDVPVGTATVELDSGFMYRRGVDDDDESVPRRFLAHQGTQRSTPTAADGRFELIGLERGTYRLRVRPESGAPLTVVPLEVTGKGVTDLGDLVIVPGAAIVGEALLPAGIAPGGLEVWLDDWREGVSAVTDAKGSFRFEDLAPGVHQLTLGERPGELAACEPLTVELLSGEMTEITIDARDRGMCSVTLTVTLGDRPAAGVQVDLVSVANPDERETIGVCDDQGRATGHVRGWGETAVHVFFAWRSMEHPTARLALASNNEVAERVTFELSDLTLVLPAGVEPPESGRAMVRLQAAEQGLPIVTALTFHGGQIDGSLGEYARAEPGLLWLGSLPVGTYELTLELVDDNAEPERVPLGGNRFSLEKPAYWMAKRPIELKSGEDLRVEF